MNFGDIRNDTSAGDLLKIMAKDRCFVAPQHPDTGQAHVYLEHQKGSFAVYISSQTVRQLLEDGLLEQTEPDPKLTGRLDKLVLTPKGHGVASKT